MQDSLAGTRFVIRLRREVAKYLTGEKSLREFYAWFVPAAWDIHLWAPARVQETAREIEYRFNEYSHGHRSEAELKARLRPFVTSVEITVAKGAAAPMRRLQSASKTIRNNAAPFSRAGCAVEHAQSAISQAVKMISSGWRLLHGETVQSGSHDLPAAVAACA